MSTGTLTHVEVQQDVTDGPTLTDCEGQPFVVDQVWHRAYMSRGSGLLVRTSTAFGKTSAGERTNTTLSAEHDRDALALLPIPPAEFIWLVKAIEGGAR